MLKKTFVQCMFGTPFEWISPYVEHFRRLESSGWYMKIFTPHPIPSTPNCEFIEMTLADYEELVKDRCGVEPKNFLKRLPGGVEVPSKLISDHYCAFGQIFQDYLTDSEYWLITNFDMTYGRLSKFLPDTELSKWDIWADEGTVAINGIFTAFRNDSRINNLFRRVPDWQKSFTEHKSCAFDEIQMTALVKELAASGEILFGHPEHFAFHTHDRLPQHVPGMKLYFEPDGALIERYDVYAHPPARVRHYGREVAMAHWQRTKRWPIQ